VIIRIADVCGAEAEIDNIAVPPAYLAFSRPTWLWRVVFANVKKMVSLAASSGGVSNAQAGRYFRSHCKNSGSAEFPKHRVSR